MDWRTYQKKQEQNHDEIVKEEFPVKKEKTIIQYNTYNSLKQESIKLEKEFTMKNTLEPCSRGFSLDDFVYIGDNYLTKEFCEHCINKFDKDNSIEPGITLAGIRADLKKTMDLVITGKDNWKEEDTIFYNSLQKGIKDYIKWMPRCHKIDIMENYQAEDTGYQIQRYEPGDGYTWHHDTYETRRHTFIWYLNDIEDEGYTEFSTGLKVQPKAGRYLMFPALWPWKHRGYPPKSERKYIVTGWIRENFVDIEL